MPAEEYDWFDIHARSVPAGVRQLGGRRPAPAAERDSRNPFRGCGAGREQRRRQFFEFAGPLFSVAVSPASSIVRVGATKELRALPRDRSRRRVEEDLQFHWQLVEGPGTLTDVHNQAVTFLAPEEPGLARVQCDGSPARHLCVGEGLITVTNELLTNRPHDSSIAGPAGLYVRARARGILALEIRPKRNVIVVNNGHRDFVYASRSKSLKLRYLVRLYAKELVLHNFAGLPADQLLERMVELSLRTEEHL